MLNEQAKNITFYCYRYYIVHNGQQSLFDSEDQKHKIIPDLIANCIKLKNLPVLVSGTTYILLHMKTIADNVNLFKFCRDSEQTSFILDEQQSDIVEVKRANYPYIFVVVDSERQVVLLEYKSAVFQKIVQAKNAFRSFLENYVHDLYYAISLQEISNSVTFWDAVNDASSIYEVSLNLKSPNCFGSNYKTNELLKEVKAIFNNDETDVKFRNKRGNLNVEKTHLENPLKYAGDGGGTWRIRYIRKGTTTKRTLTSESEVKTIEVTDFEEELSLFPDKYLIEEIRKISGAIL
ncbi:MAG: hypothetical protein EOM51_04380 [Clostridia bacterium]|nr:hypothetical protein [Clostridia bacterium]